MSRSTYIYIIRRIKCQSVLATATVKYEAHQLVDRSNGAIPRDSVELVRYRDGKIDDGEVIPWEWE